MAPDEVEILVSERKGKEKVKAAESCSEVITWISEADICLGALDGSMYAKRHRLN